MRPFKRARRISSNPLANKNTHSAVDPFPDHPYPSPEECLRIRDLLLAHQGFPPEFVKYRKNRTSPFVISSPSNSNLSSEASLIFKQPIVEADRMIVSQNDCLESVLDGLIRTLLSQNTTDVNSSKAFLALKSAFARWEDVLAAEPGAVENTIRCGGLAATKTSCIKGILSTLLQKRGKICLEYLHHMSVDEVKAELSCFKGIGPKTVACVLLFYLDKDDFPVDTHVFRITKELGWVPANADREKAYAHLNRWIPDELKFDLNCLLVTHGKLCARCANKISFRRSDLSEHLCPLLDCYV